MDSTIISHPAPAVERAARELIIAAERAGDTAQARRIDRAAADLLAGAVVIVEPGRYLTPSSTDAGVWYAIDAYTGVCDCPAHGACRHQERIAVLERAACYLVPSVFEARLAEDQARRARVAEAMLAFEPRRAA